MLDARTPMRAVTYGDMICRIPEMASARHLTRMTSLTSFERESIMNALTARFASFALCLACALPLAAHAQTATQPMGASPRAEQMMQRLQTRFATANTTHDGKLTRDQAASGMPRVAQHFDEIDTQKKGYVTLPQIEAFLRAHAAQR
jgi:hypothetical protein